MNSCFKRFLLPLRSKKAGRFEKLLGFARSHSIICDTWLSESLVRHHTTPFLLFEISTVYFTSSGKKIGRAWLKTSVSENSFILFRWSRRKWNKSLLNFSVSVAPPLGKSAKFSELFHFSFSLKDFMIYKNMCMVTSQQTNKEKIVRERKHSSSRNWSVISFNIYISYQQKINL